MSDVTSSVGFGIGLGVFSSIFAMAGFTTMRQGLAFCDQNAFMGVFLCIFSLPFLGVPLIMYATMGNIVIPITAYSILVVAFGYAEYKKRKNGETGNGAFGMFGGNNAAMIRQAQAQAQAQVTHAQAQQQLQTATATTVQPAVGANGVQYILPNGQAVQAVQAVPQVVQPVVVPAAQTQGTEVVSYSNYVIRRWLDSIGMIEYYNNFVNNGYETEDDMKTITEQDCKNIGITKYLHIKKIVDKATGGEGIGNDGNNVTGNNGLSSEGNLGGGGVGGGYDAMAPSAPGNDYGNDELPTYGSTFQ